MVKNPFAPHDGPVNRIPRNQFDLSHQHLTTTDFGRLLPIMCQEVLPGDSFRIDGNVAVRGMPTCFPLQTRIRQSVSYFYVRDRTLCKTFEDFIFKTKQVTPPWLQLNNSRAKIMISTGSLGDNLGVPSTVSKFDSIVNSFTFSSFQYSGLFYRQSLDYIYSITDFISEINRFSDDSSSQFIPFLGHDQYVYDTKFSLAFSASSLINLHLDSLSFVYNYSMGSVTDVSSHTSSDNYFIVVTDKDYHRSYAVSLSYTISSAKLTISVPQSFIDICNSYVDNYGGIYLFLFYNRYNSSTKAFQTIVSGFTADHVSYYYNGIGNLYQTSLATNFTFSDRLSFSQTVSVEGIHDSTEDSLIASNPFVGNTPLIPLSALPFRAYEMICNYYFRNDLNNPYVLNGEVQYNKFIPTDDDGPDTNLYDFHYHNWEMDMFTSCLQSPQFGNAPLVGITFSGSNVADFTFQADDNQEYHAQLGVEDDKIVNIVDFDKNIPSGNLRQLMDLVNYGISINDIRNVNSYQRFLENCQRRSLRYRNQLKSHLGVTVDYPDIDVPQYIGGFSSYLGVGQNTNFADSPDSGLGDFNGSLGGSCQSSHSINCYCPEHGFIIAIYSLYPVPLYSQSLSKYFLKSDAFDYYQSEFSKIGFVPVHYSEVTPLQNRGQGQSPSDVFGYQRAWYDYMSNRDSAHGDFRTTLQQFTISRTFEQRPTLVNDFVRVYPEQLNDIFVTNNIADRYGSNAKFMVSAFNKVLALRPIPRNGVPSLE